jgi:protein tyrosine/serine phosphatase
MTARLISNPGGGNLRRRFGSRLWLRIPALLLLWAAVAVGAYVGMLQLGGNFHTVVAGEIYRSAQPSGAEIARYQAEFGIRTIVNLRGPKTGRSWYDQEISAARRLGIAHVDFRMSSSRDLSQEHAAELIQILRSADKPILIHCRSGADRTSLAAALYVAGIAHQGEEAAEEQISIRFGHIGIPLLSSAYAMDRSWENLEHWLGFGRS